MLIGLDIHGVIGDFVGSLIRQYKLDYPKHVIQPVTAWDLANFFPIGKEIYLYYSVRRPRQVFYGAKLFPGARDFVQRLKRDGHDIWILTDVPRNAQTLILSWLQDYQIPYDHLSFTNKKHHIRCDIYLDDCPDVLKDLYLKTDGIVVCMDNPWNQSVRGGYRVKNYDEFLALLSSTHKLGLA
jgi:5'(3')-deoxyribonucleotidase